MLRGSASEEPEYVFLTVDMFQKFTLQQQGVHEALNAALKATDPSENDPMHREDQLNQALAEALELYREFWSTEENEESPNGYVAIGPLGLASVAHDAGVPIEVTSEYLPQHLHNGAWTREGL